MRFSPSPANPLIVSCGWDKLVKVWNLTNCKLRTNLVGHSGYLNTVTVSPDGSLCASGGKDGTAMLWDLNEGKHLYSLEANAIIHAMVFSPNRVSPRRHPSASGAAAASLLPPLSGRCIAATARRLLAVRRHRHVHQDLGPRVQIGRAHV